MVAEASADLPEAHQAVRQASRAAVGLSLLLQVRVVHVPWLNRAFETTPLSAGEWALCVAVASSVPWVDELKKLVVRQGAAWR